MNIISGLKAEHYHDSLSSHITIKSVPFTSADKRALMNHSTLIISLRAGMPPGFLRKTAGNLSTLFLILPKIKVLAANLPLIVNFIK
ncbi:MAG: hypothetical protein AMS27_17055 [Bacteroides sp. SM23_62_1]|nr:MAG: hypothetical protein AMS27_17055 [Bacteroides sp. SM23_62_1]